MATEEEYRDISDEVYKVDGGKVKKPYRKGDEILGETYQVLATEDNSSNGMQAMAVAPIVDGEPDTSQIVIAYAGTNSSDLKDLRTDYQSIMNGSSSLTDAQIGDRVSEHPSQFSTAVDFADRIEQTYPDATITATGHSLGSSLAMYVSLQKDYLMVGFNGPDIHNLLTEEEKTYMRNHPEQFRNFRNPNDIIGNCTGDVTKTARYVGYADPDKKTSKKKGKKNAWEVLWGGGKIAADKALYYHDIGTWKFNEQGELVDQNGEVVTDKFTQTVVTITAQLLSLQKIKTKLSEGGYSQSERIFLDSCQSQVTAQAVADLALACQEDVTGHRDSLIEKAEELWSSVDYSSYRYIGVDEAAAIMTNSGASRELLVDTIITLFDGYVQKVTSLAEQMSQFNADIQAIIQSMLEADQQLAEDFNTWTQAM